MGLLHCVVPVSYAKFGGEVCGVLTSSLDRSSGNDEVQRPEVCAAMGLKRTRVLGRPIAITTTGHKKIARPKIFMHANSNIT